MSSYLTLSRLPQVVFYDYDYAALVNDVLSGVLDAGFMMSGWFEANFAEGMESFLFLDLVDDPTFDGEPYPFLTSTQVIPGFGFMARKEIPWELQSSVQAALTRLNRTHPAARQAGISTFYPAPSYTFIRLHHEDVGLLVRHNITDTYSCLGKWGALEEVLQCPANYIRDLTGCAGRGLSCPQGRYCICSLCVPNQTIKIYLVGNISGSSER